MMKGLPKISREDTKIFVLGSFPSEISLEKQQYYANKKNQFWKIIGYCIDRDLSKHSYNEKIRMILDNKIGLWDAIEYCQRKGSSDSNITKESYNDLNKLSRDSNDLKCLIFNGKFMLTSKDRRKFLKDLKIEYFFAPSTSTAYPMKLEAKKDEWNEIIQR